MQRKLLSLAAAAVLAVPLAAQGKTITYDFTVGGGGFGPLGNVSSSGSFAFDSSVIPNGGGLIVGTGLLTRLSFTWDGISYDQSTANTGALEFNSGGMLDGLNFGDACNALGACSVDGNGHDWDLSGFTSVGPLTFAQFLYSAGDGRLYSSDQTHVAAAPEIDPAAAWSGMTLLLGGLAVLRSRRRPSPAIVSGRT